MNRMGPLDALFLHTEDGTTHMHIGSCAIFAGSPPSMEELEAHISARLHLVERFRQRVRFVPGDLGRPVWVDDQRFDLGFHLRHTSLPAHACEAQLEALMGRLMSQELDRDRPLWEIWLVEGLPDHRWALISKVHHCMVDGVSGTDLMTVLMDPSEDAGITTAPPWLPQPEPTATQLLFDALSESARGPWHQLIAIGRAAAAPVQTVHRLAATAKGMRSFAERLMKQTTPLSIEGAIGRERRWAVGRCSLADAKLIRSVFGGSVNDVVLTAITSAFHDLLIERGDLIDGATLTSLVPVSIRLPTDHDLNNRVSMMLAELPVGLSDPLERFQAVLQQMVDVKASHEAIAGTAVFEAVDLLPPAFFALLARATMSILRQTPQRAVNTVTTNVPGPQLPLFAIGREMLEYLPYVPITAGVRIGVAILSYNGQISFGVTGDYDSTPDIHTMAEGIEAAVAELTELAAHERRASTDRSAIQHRQSPGRSRATP